MQINGMKKYKILVLLTATKTAYVMSTTSNDMQRIYRSHQEGNNVATNAMFEGDFLPRLFLLEEINATSVDAFGHRVAWSAYFEYNGYTLADNALRSHIARLHPNDKLVLDLIKGVPLSLVLSPKGEIKVKYHPTDDVAKKVCFSVSPTEYAQLKIESAGVRMTVQDYCRAKFFQQQVTRPDIWALHRCGKKVDEVANMANNIASQGLINGCTDNQIMALKQAITELRAEIRALAKTIDNTLREGHDDRNSAPHIRG